MSEAKNKPEIASADASGQEKATSTAAAVVPKSKKWGNSPACVATYKVLESDDAMDQFEDVDHPFDSAGTLKMNQLRYWPGVGLPDGGLDMIAYGKAREFLILIQKRYTAKKEDPKVKSTDVINAVTKLFSNGESTLETLAATVDSFIRFPGE